MPMPAERYTHPQLNDIQEKFQLASYSEERLFHRQELRAWEEKMAKILVKRQRQELEEKRLEGLYEFLEDWGIKIFLSRMRGPGDLRKDPSKPSCW